MGRTAKLSRPFWKCHCRRAGFASVQEHASLHRLFCSAEPFGVVGHCDACEFGQGTWKVLLSCGVLPPDSHLGGGDCDDLEMALRFKFRFIELYTEHVRFRVDQLDRRSTMGDLGGDYCRSGRRTRWKYIDIPRRAERCP